MMARVLHITNTNIHVDNRILKQMEAQGRGHAHVVHGVGVYAEKGAVNATVRENITIDILHLFSARLSFLPRVLRYPFVMIELLFHAVWRGMRFAPDIVQCHDTMALPAGIALKILRGVTVVYDAHELESGKNGASKVLSKAVLWVEKFCWSRVDALITVSQSIAEWYNKNLGPKESVVILNSPRFNPIEVRNTGGDKQYFRERFGIPNDARIFIYVGLFMKGRGIEKLISVFSRFCTRSHIVFLGYGDLRGYIETHARNASNIYIHEAVPHDQVVPLVQNADVGLCLVEAVSLSDYYCLPNKLFEYCFAGIPVLASEFPDLKQVVQQYGLGVCTQPDEESMVAAIARMEREPLPPVIVDNLYSLSWAAQEDKLLDLYARLEAR